MALFRWAAVASLLLAGQAMAESIVNYTLGLAPLDTSYVEAWKNRSATAKPKLFTPGNTADNQVFRVGDVITWDMRVALDPNGLHVQANHPSNGKKPKGVANLVFTLEIHEGTGAGPLASNAVLFSAINDGNNGDPLAGSAFSVSYNIGTAGPGRVIDPVSDTAAPASGGPNLGIKTYPTVVAGRLLGQGAGYTQWVRTGGLATFTKEGVGLDQVPPTPPSTTPLPGLGTGPVFEGQIDTSNLPAGTYVIKCMPGAGVNVLRGDIDPTKNQNAFAVAANIVNGDEISFTLVNTPPPCDVAPTIASAVSRRTHGAAGEFDVPVALGGVPSVEPRSGGVTKMIVSFSGNIQPADGALDQEVVLSSGTVNGLTINGSQLVIDIAGSQPEACLQVLLHGIACKTPDGTIPAASGIMPDTILLVRQLQSDVNGDGLVASADITQVKARSGQDVTADNFRFDVNADGIIASADITQVKARSGNSLESCQ